MPALSVVELGKCAPVLLMICSYPMEEERNIAGNPMIKVDSSLTFALRNKFFNPKKEKIVKVVIAVALSVLR